MATIHRRKLRSGQVVWELTHGTGPERRRFIAGRTREEAQQTLLQFERQLALHGQAPSGRQRRGRPREYTAFLQTNRRAGTVRRYARVLKTFHQCFLAVVIQTRTPAPGQARPLGGIQDAASRRQAARTRGR